jgi:hypothetical protein
MIFSTHNELSIPMEDVLEALEKNEKYQGFIQRYKNRKWGLIIVDKGEDETFDIIWGEYN